MFTQFVDATVGGKVRRTWNNSPAAGISLVDWKAKAVEKFGDSVTFSPLQDNPEIAERAKVKALWDAVKDPAVKKLLKPLLKSLMDE